MTTLDDFFSEVCRRFGWEPTPWRLAVFDEWARHEGITGRQWANERDRLEFHWNPLATTLTGRRNLGIDLGYGPGKWNNANPPRGVGIYADFDAGVEATVATLKGVDGNGRQYYGNILETLATQGLQGGSYSEFITWSGSAAYASGMVDFITGNTASKTMPQGGPLSPAQLEAVRELIRSESLEMDDRLREVMQERLVGAGVFFGPVERMERAFAALVDAGIVDPLEGGK